MIEEPKIVKSHCNRCAIETNHFVLFQHEASGVQSYDDNQPDTEWLVTYTLLECCGCTDISLKKSFWNSDYHDDTEVFYPPRVSRMKPEFFDKLPSEYKDLLEEIYSALHADNRQLAMMGARAIIDMFMARKVGDRGNFENGMNTLEANGVISKKNREIITIAIDAGHAAAHRGHRPPSQNVSAVMDIVENMIQHDLLLDSAEILRQTTPQRANRKKKNSEGN